MSCDSRPHLIVTISGAGEAGWAFPFFDFVAAINYYHRHRAGRHSGEEGPVSANVPDMAGKVMTVRGPVDPDELGPTLMHEHLFIALYKGVRRTITRQPPTGACGTRS